MTSPMMFFEYRCDSCSDERTLIGDNGPSLVFAHTRNEIDDTGTEAQIACDGTYRLIEKRGAA